MIEQNNSFDNLTWAPNVLWQWTENEALYIS